MRRKIPREEYFAIVALIAVNGFLRVSRKTQLEGGDPTISWQSAGLIERDGIVRSDCGSRGNIVRLTSGGETYLENMYFDSRVGMPQRSYPPAYDVPEAMRKRIAAASIKGAEFDPKTQRMGIPLREWEAVLETLRAVKSGGEKVIRSGRSRRVREPASSA